MSKQANLDPRNFKPAIVYTIYIASTPEKVWEALTTAEFSRQYFSGHAVEVDQRIGGAFIMRTPDGAFGAWFAAPIWQSWHGLRRYWDTREG